MFKTAQDHPTSPSGGGVGGGYGSNWKRILSIQATVAIVHDIVNVHINHTQFKTKRITTYQENTNDFQFDLSNVAVTLGKKSVMETGTNGKHSLRICQVWKPLAVIVIETTPEFSFCRSRMD